jgi:anaerobic magnesium-protoporphyrin IX monomethyl ester cyclase
MPGPGRKKVILIYPRTLWDIVNVTTRLPLATLYIGTVLQEHGYPVQIIDQRVDDDWPDTLRQALREPPLWVGISSMTGRQIYWGLQAAQIVRAAHPRALIVWGGVHPTILPEQTLAHPLVDLVAVGEGERTALELTCLLSQQVERPRGRGLEQNEVDGRASISLPEGVRDIAGLVWQDEGRVVHNPPRSYTPMDELPLLDYDLVDVERYVLAEVPGERSLQITTSRGCPMRCGYCYLTVVPDGRRYRAESPERTVERIARLQRLYSLNAIHIIDDEFFTQLKRARRVCELILERGIEVTLRTNCRVDYIDRMDLDDLRLYRRAGFKHLYLGAESGNDRVLGFIDKGITREQIQRANAKLREVGIAPKFSFMGGFPTETIAEVKDTIHLMADLVHDNPDAYTTPVQLYSPYPGTALYDYCLRNGMAFPQSLEEWTESGWEHIDYSWLSRAEERFLQKAAYFTFFLDGKTVAESTRSPLVRLAARVYGWIVRQRVRVDFYGLMPEVHLIKWVLANSR